MREEPVDWVKILGCAAIGAWIGVLVVGPAIRYWMGL